MRSEEHLRQRMQFALAKYRLLFHHPFGTAHGLRDGTDSVFVRLSENGIDGYGEATLPPYLAYSQHAVYEELEFFDLNLIHSVIEGERNHLSPPARAALSTAYYDLISKILSISISSHLSIVGTQQVPGLTMVTVGHSTASDIALKLNELPPSSLLKVKLGSADDVQTLELIGSLDGRPIFLDANQGWTSVDQALKAIEVAGEDRVVGMEQPFGKDRWDLHVELRKLTKVPIYADESIQVLTDLERAPEAFDGVNLKLMKCGGLDRAIRMAMRAQEFGLKVMLGSMSESSLGCGAMAHLAGIADLVDLDGPWLIKNDPFEGLGLEDERLVLKGTIGVGVELRSGLDLDWNHIGA